MLQPRYATTSQSIGVIQAAYQSFCQGGTPLDTPYDPNEWPFVCSPPAIITLATEPAVEGWLKFTRLVLEWRQQRGAMSSITEAAMCPAYQSIIGMGQAAVPLLFDQLESEVDEPDQWFWALKAITGADPVRDEDRGDFLAMAKAWCRWGKNSGYAW